MKLGCTYQRAVTTFIFKIIDSVENNGWFAVETQYS